MFYIQANIKNLISIFINNFLACKFFSTPQNILTLFLGINL